MLGLLVELMAIGMIAGAIVWLLASGRPGLAVAPAAVPGHRFTGSRSALPALRRPVPIQVRSAGRVRRRDHRVVHVHAHGRPARHAVVTAADQPVAYRSDTTGSTDRRPGLTVTVVAATDRDATIRVVGEIDLATADLLTGVITAQLEQGRSRLSLDLDGVSFADCAALGVIVGAHNQCLAAHGRLTLTHVGRAMTRLLQLTDLDRTLHITDALLLAAPAAQGITPRADGAR